MSKEYAFSIKWSEIIFDDKNGQCGVWTLLLHLHIPQANEAIYQHGLKLQITKERKI